MCETRQLWRALTHIHTYISGIERKVRNPTVLIIERLAKAFKVNAGRLLD